MNRPSEHLSPGDEPIQLDAIERLRRLGRATGDDGLLLQVVTLFRRETARGCSTLHQYLAEGNLTGMQGIAHTLRGSAAMLGARRLVEVCGQLEVCADRGDAEGCAEQLANLEQALLPALVALAAVERAAPHRA